VPPPALHAGRGPAWEQELRRNSAIQSKLRREAGDRVFFSAGSAELGSRARSALAAQAVWLKRWHEFEAAIEGHADEPGSDRDNLDLSLQRAQAVRQRLIEEGVDASRVAVVPLGRTERLASCEEPDCRAQNRRSVTLVFASGTRGRLNLTDAPQAQLVDRPAAALVAPRAAEIPTGAPPAGVTR
jgi:peptidoglycan-associated lipoprotein